LVSCRQYQHTSTLGSSPTDGILDLSLHWRSLTNAAITSIVLISLFGISLILLVRGDFIEMDAISEEGRHDRDDYGWRLLFPEVFRKPPHLALLCSLVGTGAQLTLVALVLLLMGCLDAFAFRLWDSGSLLMSALGLYSISSGFAGLVAGKLFTMLGGTRWTTVVVLTSGIFSLPVAVLHSVAQIIVLARGGTQYVSWWAILTTLGIWIFISIPLNVLGSQVARRLSLGRTRKDRVSKNPRVIPWAPWHRSGPFICAIAGVMPFTSVYMEVSNAVETMWGFPVLTVYEILLVVFFTLIVAVAISSLVALYFLLLIEDHRWWWWSFMFGSSVSIYALVYSAFIGSHMTPVPDLSLVVSQIMTSLTVSYYLFIMCGSVGFLTSVWFVRFLYSDTKLK